jgi:radical SAM superfamily enzyme YgiQ (UPF0313 family)
MPYRTIPEKGSKHQMQAYPAFPYGVISIATYVKKNTDAEVRVFDYNVNSNFSEVIQEFRPSIVALSLMFDMSYKNIKEIVSMIRNNNRVCHIVIGGMAATSAYKQILEEFPEIEAVCYYEGEIPMAGLAIAPYSYDIFGAWITREKLARGCTPQKSVVKDLDEIIELDYSLVNVDNYPMVEYFSPHARKFQNKKQFYIVSSRGCPFKCTFCMHSADPDKSMRYASVSAIIKHVEHLVDTYGMNTLTFYDDQILLDRKRAKELFKQLAQFNLRIECPNGLTVAFVDDELAGLMRAAGMDTATLAVESGSPHVLKEIMKKPLHVEQVKPVVDIFHKHDFFVMGFIVNGMPGETDEDLKLTTQFIKDVGFDWVSISNATPLWGTDVYNECVAKGYIPNDIPMGGIDMKKYIIETPIQKPYELEQKSYIMNLDVNFVNNRAMKIGDYKTALRLFTDVLDRDPNHAFAYYYISHCAKKLYEQNNINEWKEYSGDLIEQ